MMKLNNHYCKLWVPSDFVWEILPMKKYFKYLPAILAVVFFGMSFIWTKILLQSYGALTIIFLRLIISVLLLFVYIFTRRSLSIKREDYKYFFLLALLEPFLYFLGENFGVNYVSPAVASIVISTIPVITPFFSFLMLDERLSIYNIIGLVLSFAGVVIVLTTKDSTLVFSMKGIMLLSLAVMSAVGYSIFVKKLTAKYSSVDIVFIQNFIGIFYFLPFFLVFEWQDFLTTQITFDILAPLLQLSIFASTFAFILITTSIRKLGVNRTNVFLNLVPIATVVFSYFLYGNVLSLQEIIGIFVVLSGLFLAQKKRKKELILHED